MTRPAPEPGYLQDILNKVASYLCGMLIGAVLYYPLFVIYDRFISPWLWKPPKVTLSTIPNCMVIKLGREQSVTSRPLEHLLILLAQNLIEVAESDLAQDYRSLVLPAPKPMFHIVGQLGTGDWSAVEGFKILGQYLRMLSEDIPYAQWDNLTLSLPNEAMDYSWLPTVLFSAPDPLPHLENLKTLTWSGHRQQLTDSWMPFTPALLKSLTTLDITCEITINDCFYLLLHCKKVTTFTLQTIVERKVDSSDASGIESVFGTELSLAEVKSIERSHLRSLTLASSQDIAPLLQPFKFPSLHEVDFNLSYKNALEAIKESLLWAQFTKVDLQGMMEGVDFIWVQERCQPGALHRHIHVRNLKDNS
ncbi:hypothetical protein DXG03_005483 [Asterophora parasitica]|uniref:Uncharacterized protein n=1 Tax=Asterophora parasitica TaxID=117018 RepID=A0A9P7KAY8_9AGAR|nr:hypothetical protein DXG03_005483 [Asterophora parasitica]